MTDRNVSEEVKEQLRIEYHLNLPLHQRYIIWVKDALHGNFGKSIKSKLSVTDMIKARLPVTLKLTLTALIVELIIAVPIGLLAAYKKDGFVTVLFKHILYTSKLFLQRRVKQQYDERK